jgi:Lrp/AsnC family leucine-responsive transcriptional regulator
MELDDLDRRILDQLQRNNQLTNQALARLVGLSSPACLRRVRRLRSQGAIRADVSLLDPEVVGQHMTLLVEVRLEREQTSVLDSFRRAVLADPEVTQCWFVTGDPDFVLVVRVPNMAAYEALTRRLFYSNPHLAKFDTLVVINEVKLQTWLPVMQKDRDKLGKRASSGKRQPPAKARHPKAPTR